MVVGQAEIAWIMCLRPSSMRLAISISPSRVSSSTEPFRACTCERVGGATEFGIDGGQSLLGFLFDFLVVGDGRRGVRHQQVLGGRGLVEDLDLHVVEGGDDRFDLLRVDDVVRKVVVDLGVRQVAALLAELDQVLEARLARLDVDRRRIAGLGQQFGGSLFLGLRGFCLGGVAGVLALRWPCPIVPVPFLIQGACPVRTVAGCCRVGKTPNYIIT